MKNEKRRVIKQLIRRFLEYEGDTICLSDLVKGDANGLRFHLNILKQDPQLAISYRNQAGYVMVTATADMVDPTSTSPVTFDGFPAHIDHYHHNTSPTRRFNEKHIDEAHQMFTDYDPHRTEPAEWITKPITRIKCAEPAIDITLDGHIGLFAITKHIAKHDRSLMTSIPNGPSPVTITHEASMVRVTPTTETTDTLTQQYIRTMGTTDE